jgi:hypothetical protein
MKKNPKHPPAIAAIVLGLMLAFVGTGSAQAQGCLDRRQIQEAVSSGQIMSLDAVLASNGVDPGAEILSVEVCDEGGRLVYVIGTLSPDGQAENLTLSAQ